jgi:hypothetical protein
MVRTASIDCGFPAARLRRIESAPSGSTPKTWQRGSASLTAVATPAQRPPPPMGTITASRPGAWSTSSSPRVAVPSAVRGPSNGWTKVRPSIDLPHALEGSVDVLDEIDLRAPPSTRGHASGVGRLGHHHLGGRAEDPGGVSDGDGVIAGADRGDAAGQRGAVEPEHHRQRASRLEGAGVLEQLELEDDLGAGGEVLADLTVPPAPHRRLDDEVAEPLAGGSDLGQRRRDHVPAHLSRPSPPD